MDTQLGTSMAGSLADFCELNISFRAGPMALPSLGGLNHG